MRGVEFAPRSARFSTFCPASPPPQLVLAGSVAQGQFSGPVLTLGWLVLRPQREGRGERLPPGVWGCPRARVSLAGSVACFDRKILCAACVSSQNFLEGGGACSWFVRSEDSYFFSRGEEGVARREERLQGEGVTRSSVRAPGGRCQSRASARPGPPAPAGARPG